MRKHRINNLSGFEKKRILEIKEALASAIRYQVRHSRYNQRHLAFITGLSESELSRVLNFKNDKITMDQLFYCLIKINHNLNISISMNSVRNERLS